MADHRVGAQSPGLRCRFLRLFLFGWTFRFQFEDAGIHVGEQAVVHGGGQQPSSVCLYDAVFSTSNR